MLSVVGEDRFSDPGAVDHLVAGGLLVVAARSAVAAALVVEVVGAVVYRITTLGLAAADGSRLRIVVACEWLAVVETVRCRESR